MQTFAVTQDDLGRLSKVVGADFRGANLWQANLTDATLSGSVFDDRTLWPQLFKCESTGAIHAKDGDT